ncbi:MAG: sigma-54-dependent Fis family transcriptional regulator [Deltaproteobacteria bacterium]|nr:sigma-54-dependent Fis family transcriptional regulator [Deltaproteobacteria bacterium]
MNPSISVLIVEDEDRMRELLHKIIAREGYEVEEAANGSTALARIEDHVYDIVLTDIKMPGLNGIELLKEIKKISPRTYVIIMTAFGTINSAVEAMKQGAYDYISKPFKLDEIQILIRKIIEERALRQEVDHLRKEVRRRYQFNNIIGKSKKMQELFDLIEKIARGKSTILIHGKSGTGKELVAKAIHYNSPRKNKPFVPVNCSAIPETLLESELFGHIKGAFTGAVASHAGLFEEADGGTLFLDEVGELSTAIQVKLLRVLQEREIKPVGGTENRKIDLRLITATNQDLHRMVEEGTFREDLYYRLNVIPIYLPPLKIRTEDIPLLVRHFLAHFGEENQRPDITISREALQILMNYSWPGNVRELENILERAVILCRGIEITADDLPPHLIKESTEKRRNTDLLHLPLREVEMAHIKRVLESVGGHKLKAAEILQIDRRTLYRKLQNSD